MSNGTHPTSEQKEWLARVLGAETWRELQQRPDFQSALNLSLGLARQLGLKHLAAKRLSWDQRAPATQSKSA